MRFSLVGIIHGNPPGLIVSVLLAFLGLGLGLTTGFCKPATAEEPCQQFLDALREERLFDVAIEYLDAMQNSPLAAPEFRERIPLHKVAVLLDEAGLIRDTKRLNDQLLQTEKVLQDFIDSAPSTILLAEAQEQRARIFMASARRLLSRAESDRATIRQKTQFREEARSYLSRAGTAYEEIRNRLRAELEKKMDPQNPNANSQREALRNKYVLVRMQSPKIKEQIADSFGQEHPDYKKLLGEAAQQNLELYDKYRTRVSGIDGCLGAARCFEKLGQPDKALGYLADIFELERGSIQLAKKREAALIAIRAWDQVTPYPLEEAFAKLRIVVYSLSPDYAATTNGIAIRMAFATVCKKMVDKIEADGGPGDAETRNRMVTLEKEATRIVRGLARTPGPHRKQAQAMLVEWGNSVAIESDPDQGPPETMADAQERGKELQLRVGQSKTELSAKQQALNQTADGAAKAGLQQQIVALQALIEKDSSAALAMFELALTFATKETSEDDLSNIRYRQCASYYQRSEFFEAAIIGEFLLEYYPTNSGTQPASELVCKAYWNMYREAGNALGGDDQNFEREQLKKHCSHIFKTWPGSRQSAQAGLLMTLLSLSEGDPVAAEKYLAEIPEDSPTRSLVVLEVGNRLWQSYVRGGKKGSMDDASLIAIRDQARHLLENGVAFLDLKDLTGAEARSALSLTELYLDSGENDLAIEQLETATIAPLDLVKTKHPAAANGNFRRFTYKTAIRAYLAKLKDGEDTLLWVEKSQGVLAALKNEIGSTPEGQKQLSDIYLTLARELKQQFETLENNQQRSAFADGLESFLTSLGSSSDDRTLMLLTGSMLSEIGQGLRSHDLNVQARRFFAEAIQVYEKLAAMDEKDPRVRLAILRGRANSLRGTGEYQKAITQFGDILADAKNRRYTEIQVDATMTYTEWGLAKNDPAMLLKATTGGEKRKDARGKSVNTIMGWMNLAKSAQRNKKDDLLAQAVYNIARCKFSYGSIKQDATLKSDAIIGIQNFRERVPEMGGANWKQKLNQLEAELKREKG